MIKSVFVEGLCYVIIRNALFCRGKWVPVTTSVLRLRMEERPLVRRVAANKLSKQERTTDKGWPSRLGMGRGSNNSSQ